MFFRNEEFMPPNYINANIEHKGIKKIGDLTKIPINCINCDKTMVIIPSIRVYDNKHQCKECRLIHKFNFGSVDIEEPTNLRGVIIRGNPVVKFDILTDYVRYLNILEDGMSPENILKADRCLVNINSQKKLLFFDNGRTKDSRNALKSNIYYPNIDERNLVLIMDHLRREQALRNSIKDFDSMIESIIRSYGNELKGSRPT